MMRQCRMKGSWAAIRSRARPPPYQLGLVGAGGEGAAKALRGGGAAIDPKPNERPRFRERDAVVDIFAGFDVGEAKDFVGGDPREVAPERRNGRIGINQHDVALRVGKRIAR